MSAPDPNQNPAHSHEEPPQGFFEWLRFMESPTGAGVDHRGPEPPFHPGFAFGFPGPWAGRGSWGARGRGFHGRGGWDRRCPADMNEAGPSNPAAENPCGEEHGTREKDDSPDTMQDIPADAPEGGEPHHHHHQHHHGPLPHHHRGPGRCGRRGGPGFRPRHRGPRDPPPYPGQGPFDFANMVRDWAGPFSRAMHEFGDQIRNAANGQHENNTHHDNDDDVFVPPVDVFNTDRAFVLHVALPGARKEDIGVNWDGEKSELNIAGVVARPGDEEFLSTLTSGERKIGMFERKITIPPPGSGENDDVDGLGITAKMEDGILIVVVPKLEKEWTEVRKVDIE